METKQTAVGWLVNKLMKESTGYISLDALTSYTEQALEMEKEQIKESFDTGYSYDLFNGGGKQYYNETYGKD